MGGHSQGSSDQDQRTDRVAWALPGAPLSPHGVASYIDELEGMFESSLRLDQEAYADELVAEHERASSFRDRLLSLKFGKPVRMRTADGAVVHGRITAVGSDWVAITQGERASGLGSGRRVECPIAAVVAVEVDE